MVSLSPTPQPDPIEGDRLTYTYRRGDYEYTISGIVTEWKTYSAPRWDPYSASVSGATGLISLRNVKTTSRQIHSTPHLHKRSRHAGNVCKCECAECLSSSGICICKACECRKGPIL